MKNQNIKNYDLEVSTKSRTITVQRLLINGMRTPDGTEIFSRSVHDYVVHLDKNGEEYMVDGGCEYLRRSVNKEPAVCLAVYVDYDHKINRQNLFWGTYGKDGDQPLKYKPLADLDTDHIEAILETQKQLPEWRREIFAQELEFRG